MSDRPTLDELLEPQSLGESFPGIEDNRGHSEAAAVEMARRLRQVSDYIGTPKPDSEDPAAGFRRVVRGILEGRDD